MLYIVTGGSGSGKSEYAELLAGALHGQGAEQQAAKEQAAEQQEALAEKQAAPSGKLYYIATMYPYDEECHRRIARHRQMRRKKGFTTIECYSHLERVRLEKEDVVLLECMSNLLANEMYMEGGRLQGENDAVEAAVTEPVKRLAESCRGMVVVTNEVFSDGIEYEPETQRYIRLLGQINGILGQAADGVIESVCAIPVWRKGEPL